MKVWLGSSPGSAAMETRERRERTSATAEAGSRLVSGTIADFAKKQRLEHERVFGDRFQAKLPE